MVTPLLALSVRRRLTTTFVALFALAIFGGVMLQTQLKADSNIPALNASDFVDPAKGANPTKYTNIMAVITDVMGFLIKFVGVAAIFAFLAGAYSYFLSGGNEEQMNKGRTQMLGSFVALFIVLAGGAIVGIFVNFFKVGHL
jgi:hypothetical protein